MNNSVFGKTFGKCSKMQKHETCDNKWEKKPFAVKTKLSYNKVFHRKCVR